MRLGQPDNDILKKRLFLDRAKNNGIEEHLKRNMHRGLETMYSPEALGSLEAKCSKMILDCVDWDS
jgi:hypothetical protein